MKFCSLKAEGLPMYKIAKAIGVHRTTLTLWYKELAEYILIAKQDYLDELLYENNNLKLCRIEKISRHITQLYNILDHPWELKKSGMTYDEVLNAIMKYTKLLHIESNEKPLERLIKTTERKKLSRSNNGNKEEGEKSAKKEPPVWVTDMEVFREIQPEENDSEEIIKEPEEIDYDMYNRMEELRDVSEEDPAVQEIFSKTVVRTFVGEKRDAYFKEADDYYKSLREKDTVKEKSVKNPSVETKK